ncbi:Vacuolar protein sorting 35B (Vps35B) [Monocercomonoides exilis]|uniref:Vacuolar protein sorting 35B (Vps35B) n=1 Tax=Monocercomonoides exilis TaxID=2049356 RepID=UPI00355A865F|nr:Vacuolar protein sorting 35B (Vps35B) [Monocercomonoides exilis]|eukprot:MONOS_10642.1-p1 / transcript=MONOS_10642.1 / gene=MONOS_10642 / organism=Monocercomonoides_exilis_PA203 / gene_product= Vacuolar protein sorting 35B (Vps35B) / transcript_product= Vacuolar protein sorting 35B (Vps35B) / location=Mono_scaffold00492:3957-7899(-) / protein_length=895 / sequence_SO=supercontig / SO=protein_coding / is_pseudo=false
MSSGRRRFEPEEDTIFTQNEQEWLNTSLKTISDNHRAMLRSMDMGNVNDAFKFAALICDELRTSLLTPQKYYALYMDVFNRLRDFEVFVGEQNKKGTPMIELYERAQYTTNILSRLYLLICVGSVYIRSGEAPAKGVLKDLVEMSKGVQHPMRGLFLRSYLSQMTKDKLPDGTSSNPTNGVLTDSLEFVLANFVEMNKLWVRMQYLGTSRDRERREKERQELRTLIGTNLVNVSNLDGVDERLYESVILPAILEQVVNCHDAVAQYYLMEIIIQIFPCEFHLISLEKYLSCFGKMEDSVDVEDLILRLIERLTKFCVDNPQKVSKDATSSLFDILSTSVNDVLKTRREIVKTAGKLRLYDALLHLVIAVYPSSSLSDYIDRVYQKCLIALEGVPQASISASGEVKVLNQLITAPLQHAIQKAQQAAAAMLPGAGGASGSSPSPSPDGEDGASAFFSTKDMLRLPHVGDMIALLAPQPRKEMAMIIMNAMNKCPPVIDQPEILEKLFEFVRPLIADDPLAAADDGVQDKADEEEFEAEQNNVAKISHMLHNEDTDAMFRLLYVARKYFGKGGIKRVKYALTPLFFVSLRLAERIARIEREAEEVEEATGSDESTETDGGESELTSEESSDVTETTVAFPRNSKKAKSKDGSVSTKAKLVISTDKVYQFVMEIISVIGKHFPDLGIRMCTQAMLSADRCFNQQYSYEFMSQACVVYEEGVADSKMQFLALRTFIGSLQQTRNMEEDNYDTLIKKTTQYSSKLVKRPDQARAVCLCSHLFWADRDDVNPYHNSVHVVECLKRSGELADKITQLNIQTTIFAEILNENLYFLSKNIDKPITGQVIAIITFIQQRLPGLDEATIGPMQSYFNNTIKHIEREKSLGEKPLFQDISLPSMG